MKILMLLFALVAGMLAPLQAGLNTRMGRVIGDPVSAALISFVVGAVSLWIYLLAARTDLGNIRQAFDLHWVYWCAGCLGAVFVAATIILTPKLGAALTFSLVIAGQLIMAVFMDHFGLFGIQAHPVSWMRVMGIVLITLGVAVIRKF